MREPIYRQALSRSWELVWHHKILWIFGLFSIFLGQFGLTDFVGRLWMALQQKFYTGTYWGDILTTLWPQTDVSGKIGLIWILGILLALGVLVLLLSVLSQGSLIIAAKELFKNKKEIKTSQVWNQSVRSFWPLFLINLIRECIFIFLTTFLGAMVYFLNSGHAINYFFIGLIIVVGTLLALIVSSVAIYTACYVVIDHEEILKALKKGWQLFSEHLLVSLELSLLLLLMNFVALVAIFIGSTLVFIPSVVIWIVAGFTGNFVLMMIGQFLGMFLFALMMILVAAILNAYTISAWTYLFLKMHHQGVVSRLIHFAKAIVKR